MLRRMLGLEALESRRLLAGDVLLSAPDVYSAGGGPGGVAVGDFNNDEIPDLVVGSYECCGRLAVLLGKGDGTFDRQIGISTRGSFVTVADFDGDGDSDVGVAAPGDNRLSVLLNKGVDGGQWSRFDRPTAISLTGNPQGIVSADFDGDGDVDVAVGTGGMSIWVLLNKGVSDGAWQGFDSRVSYATNSSHSSSLATGDIDGDGDLDLAVGTYFGGKVSVLLGNGDGSFSDGENFHAGNRASSIELGDLDGDQNLDAVVAVFRDRVLAVLLGDGTGKFGEPAYVSVDGRISGVEMGDLDNDGDLDLVAEPYSGRELHILINQSDGTFRQQGQASAGEGSLEDVAVADLDGNGTLDLAVANFALNNSRANGVAVLHNATGLERNAVWDGEAMIGNPGDGTSWADANNWSVDGIVDTLPASTFPGDGITFGAGTARTTVQLGGECTAHSLRIESPLALEANALKVTTGGVDVASEVTATISSNISEDTSLTKTGAGTLILNGSVDDTTVVSGTLVINGTAAATIVEAGFLAGSGTLNALTVEGAATVSPGSPIGSMHIDRKANIGGTLLIELNADAADQLHTKLDVNLLEGSQLELQALESFHSSGETLTTILTARHVDGTFTGEPTIGEHIGSGVFTLGALGMNTPIMYVNNSVVVSLFQAGAGDANGDGLFDQVDIVQVLQANKYLTGEAAEWTEGDWNGDNTFDQEDVVAALQSGAYLLRAHASHNRFAPALDLVRGIKPMAVVVAAFAAAESV